MRNEIEDRLHAAWVAIVTTRQDQCPACSDYAGRCPKCGRRRPSPAAILAARRNQTYATLDD